MKRNLAFEQVSEWELGIFLNGACLGTWDLAYAPTEHAVDELIAEIEETYGELTNDERARIVKEINELYK